MAYEPPRCGAKVTPQSTGLTPSRNVVVQQLISLTGKEFTVDGAKKRIVDRADNVKLAQAVRDAVDGKLL